MGLTIAAHQFEADHAVLHVIAESVSSFLIILFNPESYLCITSKIEIASHFASVGLTIVIDQFEGLFALRRMRLVCFTDNLNIPECESVVVL